MSRPLPTRADQRRKRILRAALLLLPLLLLAPASADAAEDMLTLELWAETEPAIHETDEYPLSIETAVSQLLDETRFVLSGMIYGYRYHYQPADPRRGVQERFELTPISTIPWGDEGLVTRHTRQRESRVYVSFLYYLNDYQQRLQESWSSAAIDGSAGRAEVSLTRGHSGRLEAIEASIQNAIRRHLQFLTRNRPRSSEGELLLESAPRLRIDSGHWIAESEIRLIVSDIAPHSSY